MIIFNKVGLLGDTLATFPAILEAANHQKVYLVSENRTLTTLMPHHPNLEHIYQLEQFFDISDLGKEPIRILDAGKDMSLFSCDGIHMAQGHYYFLDLPIPYNIPTVEFNIKPNVFVSNKTYDFLISAGSNSDHNFNKKWPFNLWQIIITWLHNQGYSVGNLSGGADQDPKFENADEIRGDSLHNVALYIQRVKKAVISIDNGISHFTRMLNAPHILLYPQCLPYSWVGNPTALYIQKEPLELTVDEVKALVSRVLP